MTALPPSFKPCVLLIKRSWGHRKKRGMRGCVIGTLQSALLPLDVPVQCALNSCSSTAAWLIVLKPVCNVVAVYIRAATAKFGGNVSRGHSTGVGCHPPPLRVSHRGATGPVRQTGQFSFPNCLPYQINRSLSTSVSPHPHVPHTSHIYRWLCVLVPVNTERIMPDLWQILLNL